MPITILCFVWLLIAPFAHGVPMKEVEEGFLSGKDVWKFMRAFYGLVVCTVIGVVVTLFTKARPIEDVKGLVWGTVNDAIAWYKGSPGEEVESDWAAASGLPGEDDRRVGKGLLPVVTLSPGLAGELGAKVGDLVYISDARAWLGGLKASHAVIDGLDEGLEGSVIVLGPRLQGALGGTEKPLRVKRLY